MAEHLFGKILIDDDHAGPEVCRHSSQSEAIFCRLNFEVGIGNDGRYRAQHHRSNEDRHRWNALRHDNHHAIADSDSMIAEQCGLHTGTATKLAKRHGFARRLRRAMK